MATTRRVLAVLLVALGGCSWLVVGDGAFGITGTVPANAKNCEIALFSDTGTELRFTRRAVRQEFREGFVVAPSAATYQVVVTCDGKMRKSLIVRYGAEVKPGQWVSLGEIAL